MQGNSGWGKWKAALCPSLITTAEAPSSKTLNPQPLRCSCPVAGRSDCGSRVINSVCLKVRMVSDVENALEKCRFMFMVISEIPICADVSMILSMRSRAARLVPFPELGSRSCVSSWNVGATWTPKRSCFASESLRWWFKQHADSFSPYVSQRKQYNDFTINDNTVFTFIHRVLASCDKFSFSRVVVSSWEGIHGNLEQRLGRTQNAESFMSDGLISLLLYILN